MSTPLNSDPRLDRAAVTDETLLVAHEKLLGTQPDDKGHYSLLPLGLLFFFSGLIFFGGTYLGLFSGHFDSKIFNETAKPGGAVAAAPTVSPVELGKKTFATTCASCHQVTGLGLPGAVPPLAGSEWVNGSEERLIRAVYYGLTGPIKVKGQDFNLSMLPKGGFPLSDEKVAAILTYIRQEWGNQAPEVTPQKVAEIHGKEGEHPPFAPADLLKLQ